MDIFAQIRGVVLDAIEEIYGGEISAKTQITMEPPKDPAHGDMASNAAMVLAKPLGAKPREIAENLAAHLEKRPESQPIFQSIEIAGPGFMNFRLSPSLWENVLASILQSKNEFGRNQTGAGIKINVEYVSANPTGPLHIGHVRGAVVGDALANLLEWSGFDVAREYYINDGGAQVDVLARSIYLRYLEQFGHDVSFPDGTYPGDYLVDVGQALAQKFGDQYLGKDESEWLTIFRDEGVNAMMALIKKDLASLGVSMDVYFSERSLYESGKIEHAIEKLQSKGLIYQGVLPPPKGKPQEDWEAREQMLFKSTDFGDDVDRPIQKSDGSWTYFAPDIAYHNDKIERGFGRLIDVLGADHGGYVKRMNAAVSALSNGDVAFTAKLCQLVRLFKNGEPFKMSKRAGNFVLLSDVIDEVGADVTRFEILTRKSDAPLDFDFDKVKEQSKDNPVFYVQYAHARASSVLEKGAQITGEGDPSLLQSPMERALIQKLANFPRMVLSSAQAEEPHRISFYLYELASEFHALQHQGKIDPNQRFIVEGDKNLTRARLDLVRACRQVIANGLQIMGVSPMDNM